MYELNLNVFTRLSIVFQLGIHYNSYMQVINIEQDNLWAYILYRTVRE